MKRTVFGILLIVVIAIVSVSCSERDNLSLNSVREVELLFALDTENGNMTRAISDGNSVDKLIYAVFAEDGTLVVRNAVVENVNSLVNGGIFNMTVSLADGQRYRAVFWAQNGECDAYALTEDMKLAVDYSGIGNDDRRDAFYGVSELFEVDGKVKSVILRRPFAQINAVAYPFDWEYVTDFHDFTVTKSCAVIRDVPNCMDLLTGELSGSVSASFQASEIPSERYYADVDGNGVDEEYVYLSMSYVLAGSEPTTHNADFFFIDKDNMAVMYEHESNRVVELKRNNRSDIIGQVITDNGELNRREFIQTGTVYQNITADTLISNTIYNMSGHDAIQFASVDGQLTTLDNVLITGDIWTIELGEYRGGKYVNYNNVLNNVTYKDLRTTSHIECHEWYFSPACIAYGNTTLNNCVMTGAKSINDSITDQHGTHKLISVDLGVRNESDAVINGGVYGTLFAWTHAIVNIYGAVVDTLYCGTCDSTDHSWMTIGKGTVIDRVICCEPRCPYGSKEYSTTMTIESGAKVGALELVSTDVEFLIIEDGADVGSITCDGVEYTYEELRSAMGL
ncbi:MAG: hypothetical protein J6K83_05070 [Bacteroidaceae bacterium]|nr:hypothetical protein [Bacteroidaceae bacterium]